MILMPEDNTVADVKTPEVPSTTGIALLMGDPKKAIIKLSGPMIAAMLLMSTYNIVNAIWVAGLGSDALAAVGFVTPLFMILIGLSNGLGAGVASVISRRIGAKDRKGADNAAVHALILVLILSATLTVPLILLTGPIVTLFGAGDTAGLATTYGQIIFLGMVLILFTNIAYAILRAEGDATRAMYVMGASSVLNIILDPLLIYAAGMGIAGAAWGLIFSLVTVSGVLLYWFFIKRDTYVTISFTAFSWDKKTMQDILGVGLPASVEFFLMSVLAIFINGLLVPSRQLTAVASIPRDAGRLLCHYSPCIALPRQSYPLQGIVRCPEGCTTTSKRSIPSRSSAGEIIDLVTSALTYVFCTRYRYHIHVSSDSAHLARLSPRSLP
jgi:Na+-driven multidrug efflux pump